MNFDNFEKEIVDEGKSSGGIVEIPLDEIRSNPYQPRVIFDSEALEELANSIKEHGVIQPIIVKKGIKGYELVAGERRTRAAKLAGLKNIPAIIKEFNDVEMMEIALIENIERENLNPIEEAKAYENILKINNITQEELAHKFSRSRSYITNMLGLLTLPDMVIKLVESKELSMGHARALSKLEDPKKIEELAIKIVHDDLSVRDTEKMINALDLPKKHNISRNTTYDIRYSIYENLCREKLGVKVKISNKKIEIPYKDEDELARILEELNINIEGE
ncbi:MAG TPA: ParB/RepB/Spo0J family partition protein [Candidatus Caccenecus avistercoris]|nr:ParB/RepB/Spo0J family partition protein [Candidatus Caccenecus avistercoris]